MDRFVVRRSAGVSVLSAAANIASSASVASPPSLIQPQSAPSSQMNRASSSSFSISVGPNSSNSIVECPICGEFVSEINQHLDGECRGPSEPVAPAPVVVDRHNEAEQEVACPSCQKMMKAKDVYDHLPLCQPEKPPSPKKVCRRLDETPKVALRSRRRSKAVIESPNLGASFSLLDSGRHIHRKDVQTSRMSLLSRRHRQGSANTRLICDTDKFDFLLDSCVDHSEVDHNFLNVVRTFAHRNIRLPLEAFNVIILKWMLADHIPLVETQHCYVCIKETIAEDYSQWTPLDTDWPTFIELLDIIASPLEFLEQARSKHADDDSTESLDDLVQPVDLLHKKFLVFKLFVAAFDADVQTRKSDSVDLGVEGMLRSLVGFAAQDNNTGVASIVSNLRDKCDMAKFAAQVSDDKNTSALFWEIYFVAEHLTRILNDCFSAVF